MMQIIFYSLAAILIFSAIMVVTVRNPVKAALFLVLAFFTSAAIWLTLEAEFLALTLVLVYVGAVMVLFLFVVMMLDIRFSTMQEQFTRYLPLGILISALITVEMIAVVGANQFGLDLVAMPQPKPEDYSNTAAIGMVLYTTYVYPFELASVILTVAIIAAIALTLRQGKRRQSQQVSEQIKVKAEQRVRLVTMNMDKEEQSS
ncbi:MAG TPA: NADH-quinone oxidoreductase subunit J [Gammaproteobacteria bacterium]|nr:NADH-quinone oxidoreductase subunit J [Gammaproteobacteria bacterium]